MVWGAVAGAVVGAVGSAIASKNSAKASKDASRAASEAEAERLAFDRERYEEWQATYGPLEDNLARYYNNLDPELRTTMGLEAYEREKDIALTQLRETLDQRGIGTSGIAGQLETEIALASAEERARIRADAPMETAREQAAFLQIGLGQDPSGDISQGLAEVAERRNRESIAAAQIHGQNTRRLIESGVNVAEELINVFDSSSSSGSSSGGTGGV